MDYRMEHRERQQFIALVRSFLLWYRHTPRRGHRCFPSGTVYPQRLYHLADGPGGLCRVSMHRSRWRLLRRGLEQVFQGIFSADGICADGWHRLRNIFRAQQKGLVLRAVGPGQKGLTAFQRIFDALHRWLSRRWSFSLFIVYLAVFKKSG